jgi:hypothetical protein
MALRDHYVEQTAGKSGLLAGPHDWALMYITIGRAHGIQEAFDGDASGVVTINGVNNFTKSKPLNWRYAFLPCSVQGLSVHPCHSLPHWIAYWAIGNPIHKLCARGLTLLPGWQMICTTYCVKIEEIFDAMIRLSYATLPENRQAISDHINRVWRRVTVLALSIKREQGTKRLRSRFESYPTTEEEGIRESFEELKYQIDGSDTVQLICGESRPETVTKAICAVIPCTILTRACFKTLFPMFYLALKRDLQKISLARDHVLSAEELVDSQTTLNSIVDVAFGRIERLRGESENQVFPFQS